MAKKGLGKGLGALLITDEEYGRDIREIKINDIEPNINQPRKSFDDEKLAQLAESIKQHGIVQPIIVRKENDTYRIVAGERRWRAARIAGLKTVPAIIKELSNSQVMEIALIENLQRQDLNPIEEAEAFERLLKEYNMTQEQISGIVGRSRSAVANSLRLLNLEKEIREFLIEGLITSGHARALLAVENKELQLKFAEEIIKRELNVRDTEKFVKRFNSEVINKKPVPENIQFREIEDRLKDIFGTKVKLVSGKNRGKIMIEYYSNDELDRILELVNYLDEKKAT